MGLFSKIPRWRSARTYQADTLREVAENLLRTPDLSFRGQLDIIEGYTELAQRYGFEPEIKPWVLENAKEEQP